MSTTKKLEVANLAAEIFRGNTSVIVDNHKKLLLEVILFYIKNAPVELSLEQIEDEKEDPVAKLLHQFYHIVHTNKPDDVIQAMIRVLAVSYCIKNELLPDARRNFRNDALEIDNMIKSVFGKVLDSKLKVKEEFDQTLGLTDISK